MNKTTLLLWIIGLATTPQSNSVFARIEAWLAQSRYEADYPPRYKTDIPLAVEARFTSRSKGLSVNIEAGQKDTAEAVHDWVTGISNAMVQQEERTLGNPIGQHCFVEEPGKTYNATIMRVQCDRYVVTATVSFSRTAQGEQRDALVSDSRRVCEGIVRRVLGDAMAMDLNDDGSERGTAHMTGIETDKRGFVPLSTWAEQRGITVAYDDVAEVASFTYRNRLVRLPLAANKVLVAGREEDLGGKFLMARGSRWFVPAAELDRAIGP